MVIDTSAFRKTYRVDAKGKYAHYKSGKCSVCGKETSQCDASLLWDGLVTYICSDGCNREYWKMLFPHEANGLVDQTEED